MKKVTFLMGALSALAAFGAGRIETVSMITHVNAYRGNPRWPEFAKKAGLTTLGTHIHGYDVTAFLKSAEGKTFVEDCDRLGVTIEHEVHAFWELLPRKLFATKPELFPVMNGKRYRGNNCCFTNPEARELIASNAVALAKLWAHGEKTCHRYYFWPDDLTGPCECETCKAYNAAEQALLVENEILRKLREFDPQASLSHLAYGRWAVKPEKVKPADGVFLEYAPINRDRSREMDAKTLAELKSLLEVFPVETAQVLEYWLDYGLFSGWRAPECRLPFNGERLRADIDAYAKLGIRHFATFGLTSRYLDVWGEAHSLRLLGDYAKSFRDWPYAEPPDPNARLDMKGYVAFSAEASGEETLHLKLEGNMLDFREKSGDCLKWRSAGIPEVSFLPAENGVAKALVYRAPCGFAPVVRKRFATLSYDIRSNSETRKIWDVPFFLHRDVELSDDGLRFAYGFWHSGRTATALPAATLPSVRIKKPAQIEVVDLAGWSVIETEDELVVSQDEIPPFLPGGKNGKNTGFTLRPKGRVLKAVDFNSDVSTKLPKGSRWRWSANEGRGGSGALVWTSDSPTNTFAYFGIPCNVKPGMTFEASVWVKIAEGDTEENKHRPIPSSGALWGGRIPQDSAPVHRWNATGLKEMPTDKDGWRQMAARMMMPMTADSPDATLPVNARGVGKVLFDDCEVLELGRVYAGPILSSRYRGEAENGTVRFSAPTYIPQPDIDAKQVTAVFRYTDKDGKAAEKKADLFDAFHAEVTLDIGDMAKGTSQVELVIRTPAKRVYGTSATDFTRLSAPSTRKVRVDEFGRTLVNGEPFFPLGMFVHRGTIDTTNRIETLVKPGVFNCVLSYRATMTWEELDRWQGLGLRVIPSLNDHYPPWATHIRNGRTKTRDGADAWTAEVVNRCKGHPALLAWYTLDEKPSYMKDEVIHKYERLKRLDPDHPAFMVTWDANAVRAHLGGYDVAGIDKYPIWPPQPLDRGHAWAVGDATEQARFATMDITSIWTAPQAYAYQRFPTELEMKAQTWLAIAAGANGIIYYSFGEMDHRFWGAGKKCPPPAEFLEYFRRVTAAAAEVKAVMPMLLGEPGEPVEKSGTGLPQDFRVRTWKGENGSLLVLIANRRPDPAVGEILPAKEYAALETKLGSGASLEKGKLHLALPAFGSTLVRLAPTITRGAGPKPE